MSKESNKKKKHSKTKYYFLAALSYLINTFVIGLVITESGKNQLKKHSFFALSPKFLFLYTVIASVLMFFFYYKRYIKRKHFQTKTKIQAWVCVIIHIIHPILFLYSQDSVLFMLFLLFMIFIDCLFLTLNPPRSTHSIIGDYISIAAKFLLVVCCVLCPVFFACFLLNIDLFPINIISTHITIFLIYSLLFFEYVSSY